MKSSDEAQMVLNNKYGYRTDDQSEWYVPDDPVAIMTQETEDLGNDDILDTLNVKSVESADKKIKKDLGADQYHVVWLTAKKDQALEYADDQSGDSIYKVDLSDRKICIVSDIGSEGVLVAYTGSGCGSESDVIEL